MHSEYSFQFIFVSCTLIYFCFRLYLCFQTLVDIKFSLLKKIFSLLLTYSLVQRGSVTFHLNWTSGLLKLVSELQMFVYLI